MAGEVCEACGHRNPLGSNFCSSCGSALSDTAEPTTVTYSIDDADDRDHTLEFAELPDGVGALIATRGPNAGARYLLDDGPTITAGRHPDSEIFLDDVTVSRRHAEIAKTADGYVVRDVGSLNGTYLNRERIDGEAPLANGDEIQIGTFRLVFMLGGAA